VTTLSSANGYQAGNGYVTIVEGGAAPPPTSSTAASEMMVA
jgi:hypothetical protein